MVESKYAWAGPSGLKVTPDFTEPMWDTTHAPNYDTGTSGCAASCEKGGNMIRNRAEMSVRIDK